MTKIALDGEEDFLVIASDGLWEAMTEDNIAVTVYKMIRKNPGESYSCIRTDGVNS